MNKEPLNFVFGKVKNRESVFLIQNMFPTIEKYILEKYTINKTNDITIFEDIKIAVLNKARSVLKLAKNRNIHIAFKKELLNE